MVGNPPIGKDGDRLSERMCVAIAIVSSRGTATATDIVAYSYGVIDPANISSTLRRLLRDGVISTVQLSGTMATGYVYSGSRPPIEIGMQALAAMCDADPNDIFSIVTAMRITLNELHRKLASDREFIEQQKATIKHARAEGVKMRTLADSIVKGAKSRGRKLPRGNNVA